MANVVKKNAPDFNFEYFSFTFGIWAENKKILGNLFENFEIYLERSGEKVRVHK